VNCSISQKRYVIFLFQKTRVSASIFFLQTYLAQAERAAVEAEKITIVQAFAGELPVDQNASTVHSKLQKSGGERPACKPSQLVQETLTRAAKVVDYTEEISFKDKTSESKSLIGCVLRLEAALEDMTNEDYVERVRSFFFKAFHEKKLSEEKYKFKDVTGFPLAQSVKIQFYRASSFLTAAQIAYAMRNTSDDQNSLSETLEACLQEIGEMEFTNPKWGALPGRLAESIIRKVRHIKCHLCCL